jgi:hypothetical protein
MDKYVYQVDARLDGRFYCWIYQFGFPDALATADDYGKQEDAIEAAEEIINGLQLKTDGAK